MLAAKLGPTDGVRVLGWLGELDRLRLVFGRLGESAELGEAHDQPSATEDRCRHGHAEIFVDPFGGQRREVLGGDLDHVLVLAPVVVRLLEIARGEECEASSRRARWAISRARVPVTRASSSSSSVDRTVVMKAADLATSTIVFQPLGEGLGLAEMLEHLPDLTELAQHRPQLEANLEGLLHRGLALRQ